MIKTHKIKIYPNSTMRKQLEKLFDYRRYVWNQALNIWQEMYDESLVLNDKHYRPNERKVRNELVNNKQDWQYALSARVLQLAVNDLAKAWKNFFNPAMPNHAMPNFKSKKRSQKTFKTDRAKIVNGKLRLDKPRDLIGGWFDIRLSEQARFEGKIKQVCIKQESDGYYVSLSIETNSESLSKTGKMTAVDVNVGKFDYKSDDGYEQLKTLPKQLLTCYQRIAAYQRQLARKRVANPKSFRSKKYQSVKTKLARTYQKAERIQEDLLQKFTTQLVHTYDVIGIEDLNVNGMKMGVASKGLHRSMFGKFREVLRYKADWYGKEIVLADRFFASTQRCSECGFIKTGDDKVTLHGNKKHHTKHNEYICYECGAVMERDENAVENLYWYVKHYQGLAKS
jgi:putative transposase